MGETTKFERVAVDTLIPYVNNANIHSEKQVTMLASSIREFGFLNPVLIDRKRNVIAGHGRILAAKKLGLETVPCIFVEGLTEAQRKAYILADNRLAEFSEWDMDLVMGELEGLEEYDFDIGLIGFEMPEVLPENVEDDYEERDVEPRAKLGDVWRLGAHRLMCGDSTDPNAIERLMGGCLADIVFTDPPWNVNYGATDHPTWKSRSILNDYWGNLMLALAENDYHWSSTIIWAKDQLVLSRKDYHTQYEPIWYGWKNGSRLHPLKDRKQSDVWEIARPKRSDEHPTMKPVELVARALANSSNVGDVVLDLFGGSGTTLIAAEQLERVCYMCELDPHYVDVIIDRWEQLTGEKAVLIDD